MTVKNKRRNIVDSKPIGLKDLKNDRIFKFYFKTYKQHLAQLLNTFLPLEKDQHIKEIHFFEEKLHNSHFNKKESFLDIRVGLDTTGIANVEMQRFHDKYFPSRALLYASKLYSSQLKKGDDYEKLKPVYSLLICAKPLFPQVEEYYSTFSLRHDKKREVLFTKNFKIALIQLDKFQKGIGELVEKKDGWCYILKNSPELSREGFEKLSRMEGLGGVMWDLEKLSKSETAEVFEEHAEKMARDERSRLITSYEDGVEKGIEKGMKEGREQGIAEKSKQTALQMLSENMDISMISKITGLSETEINELKK